VAGLQVTPSLVDGTDFWFYFIFAPFFPANRGLPYPLPPRPFLPLDGEFTFFFFFPKKALFETSQPFLYSMSNTLPFPLFPLVLTVFLLSRAALFVLCFPLFFFRLILEPSKSGPTFCPPNPPALSLPVVFPWKR